MRKLLRARSACDRAADVDRATARRAGLVRLLDTEAERAIWQIAAGIAGAVVPGDEKIVGGVLREFGSIPARTTVDAATVGDFGAVFLACD